MTEPTAAVARLWVLALTAIVSFMATIDALVVTTAPNVIQRDLGASIAVLEWIVNPYNLLFAGTRSTKHEAPQAANASASSS